MDLQMISIRASFTSREQAGSAMRKLAALRGDGFRLESIGDDHGLAEPEHEFAMLDSGYNFLLWGDSSGETFAPAAKSFILSANVPAAAAAQARSVIEDAGGRMM